MMRIVFPVLMILVSLYGDVYAADNQANPSGNLPAVACRYESSRQGLASTGAAQTQTTLTSSYFWRAQDRVETRDASGETGALWERGNDGVIFFRKLYHQAHKAIEYYPDDLRAAGNNLSWDAVASTFDSKLLGGALKRVGKEIYLDRDAERYHGEVDGVWMEVVWLTQERLPALVKKTTARDVSTLQLAEIWPIDKAPWPASTRATLEQYHHLDFADLGDMESDPFVRWAVVDANIHTH
jgi:hypothetical protein